MRPMFCYCRAAVEESCESANACHASDLHLDADIQFEKCLEVWVQKFHKTAGPQYCVILRPRHVSRMFCISIVVPCVRTFACIPYFYIVLAVQFRIRCFSVGCWETRLLFSISFIVDRMHCTKKAPEKSKRNGKIMSCIEGEMPISWQIGTVVKTPSPACGTVEGRSCMLVFAILHARRTFGYNSLKRARRVWYHWFNVLVTISITEAVLLKATEKRCHFRRVLAAIVDKREDCSN